MKKLSTLLVLLVAFTFGVVAQDAPANPNAPVITFKNDTYNFKELVQGDSVKVDFEFTNTGKSNLILKDVTVTCGCTTPYWPKEVIKPGQNSKITAVFHSAGKMGQQDKIITISSNAAQPIMRVHLKGNVKAADGK
jgi:hypothetical protein